jgi:cell division septation protein DedD
VTATSNAAAAQDLVQALKEKGLPARTSPGRDNLTRVLVGPYSDRTAFAKAKTDIESGGFGTPVVAK